MRLPTDGRRSTVKRPSATVVMSGSERSRSSVSSAPSAADAAAMASASVAYSVTPSVVVTEATASVPLAAAVTDTQVITMASANIIIQIRFFIFLSPINVMMWIDRTVLPIAIRFSIPDFRDNRRCRTIPRRGGSADIRRRCCPPSAPPHRQIGGRHPGSG